MIRIKCTGAWVKGAKIRESCGWSKEINDPATPAHLAKAGGFPRNRWASCPECGGSVTFFRPGPLMLVREWAGKIGRIAGSAIADCTPGPGASL